MWGKGRRHKVESNGEEKIKDTGESNEMIRRDRILGNRNEEDGREGKNRQGKEERKRRKEKKKGEVESKHIKQDKKWEENNRVRNAKIT